MKRLELTNEQLYGHIFISETEYYSNVRSRYGAIYRVRGIAIRLYYAYSLIFKTTLTWKRWIMFKMKCKMNGIPLVQIADNAYLLGVKHFRKFIDLYESYISKDKSKIEYYYEKFEKIYKKEEYREKRDQYGIPEILK